MDRLFLDPSVLFSAAYRPDSGLRRLWERAGTELVTSGYALEEARHNLGEEEARKRLMEMARPLEVVVEPAPGPVPEGVEVPDAARPLLRAALHAAATHLVTGDVFRFGPYFGMTIQGMEMVRPGSLLGD